MTERKPYCCYIDAFGHDCGEDARWRLYGPGYEDSTDSCIYHVGQLVQGCLEWVEDLRDIETQPRPEIFPGTLDALDALTIRPNG